MKKIDPHKVYLVKGSTLAQLQGDIDQRSPIPSNSQQRYSGPAGFIHPTGTGGGVPMPFEVSSRGGQIYVQPGLLSVHNWTGTPFVPRAYPGGPPLDTLPQPSCGRASDTGPTHVHLSFDCGLISEDPELTYQAGRIYHCWVSLFGAVLPHRLQVGAVRWLFHMPIGRVAGGQTLSILNSNLRAYLDSPFSRFPPDVRDRMIGVEPTLSLGSPAAGIGYVFEP
jgi:hypothetical protein